MKAPAPAKVNLGLVVGPLREDGRHELLTIYQRLGMADRIELDSGVRLRIEGFAADTLVLDALTTLASSAEVEPRWHVRIEKRLPVAAGIGGGSSDAATALRLANRTLAAPLPAAQLHELAAGLGADVPFFLADGPQLGSGDGTALEPVDLPQDFWVLLVLPHGQRKASTGAVYADFDARDGAAGWEERRAAFLAALASVRRPRDLAALPRNDLVSSPLTERLRELGAFRADVSGSGPAVYGLFHHRATAQAARRALRRAGRSWVAAPAWYG